MNPVRSILFALLAILAGVVVGLAQDAPPAAEPSPSEKAPAPPEKAPAAHLSADPIVICRNVEDRTPVGEGVSFPSDVGQLYCFTKVLGAQEPVQIYHRWYMGDTLTTEVPITVKAASWRCWSVKSIQPSWSGTCRVDVATEAGDVIATTSFQLQSAAPSE